MLFVAVLTLLHTRLADCGNQDVIQASFSALQQVPVNDN